MLLLMLYNNPIQLKKRMRMTKVLCHSKRSLLMMHPKKMMKKAMEKKTFLNTIKKMMMKRLITRE